MDGTLSKMGIVQRYWMRDMADHALFVRKNLTVDQLKDAEKALYYHQQFRDHLVKENEYYLKLISEETPSAMDNRRILYELVFWLRQTFEHTMFIMHWADPYEFTTIKKAQDFAQQFSYLLNKARSFVSMMSTEPVPEIPSPPGTQLGPQPALALQPIPALMYLVTQSLDLIEEYKNHLLSIRPMVQQVQSLGVLSTRFVDHQTREAEYFIAVLKYILTGDTNTFNNAYAEMPFAEEYINGFL